MPGNLSNIFFRIEKYRAFFDFFKDSSTQTECHWKGTASYYNIVVDGQINYDAAWYYPEPKEKAQNIPESLLLLIMQFVIVGEESRQTIPLCLALVMVKPSTTEEALS